MALSNIFREPRREITETGIGLAIVAVPGAADFCFGLWVHREYPPNTLSDGMVSGLVLLVGIGILMFLCACLLRVSHALGEAICDKLEGVGIHLRPRQRK
jgi:hypothetical protein